MIGTHVSFKLKTFERAYVRWVNWQSSGIKHGSEQRWSRCFPRPSAIPPLSSVSGSSTRRLSASWRSPMQCARSTLGFLAARRSARPVDRLSAVVVFRPHFPISSSSWFPLSRGPLLELRFAERLLFSRLKLGGHCERRSGYFGARHFYADVRLFCLCDSPKNRGSNIISRTA